MIELGIASFISVSLILVVKRQRRSTTWARASITMLVAWAVALPFLMPTNVALFGFQWLPALAGGVLIVATAYCNVFVARKLGWNVSRLRQLRYDAQKAPWRSFALMVVAAPVCEEFIFRGFVLQTFLGLGTIAAILSSTSLFAAAHFDASSVPHLIIAGVLFSALALLTGGLATPIVAHAIANFVGFAGLRSGPSSRLLDST